MHSFNLIVMVMLKEWMIVFWLVDEEQLSFQIKFIGNPRKTLEEVIKMNLREKVMGKNLARNRLVFKVNF